MFLQGTLDLTRSWQTREPVRSPVDAAGQFVDGTAPGKDIDTIEGDGG